MPSLNIRNVDDAIVSRLKTRAARHHRSLQGELKTILEEAVSQKREAGAKGGQNKLRLRTVRLGGKVSYSRSTIYENEER